MAYTHYGQQHPAYGSASGGGGAAVGQSPFDSYAGPPGGGSVTGWGGVVQSQDSGGIGQSYSLLFKFIIIGDEAVGKTCLLLQFTDKRYRTSHQVTVGVEFGSRTVDIAGRLVKLQCWDTAGQDRFRSIIRSYYRGAAGALLVYDITRKDSFEHVSQWVKEARQNADPDLMITLVGNKCDKVTERQVSYEEGHAFAHRNGLYFLETSAVTGHMVDEAFTVTAKLVYQRNVEEQHDQQGASYGDAGSHLALQNDYLGGGISQGHRISTLRLANDRDRGAYGQQQPQGAGVDSCCG